MPIFEYECIACGNQFEHLVRSSDDKVPCPDCGGEQIKKLFSAFAHRSSGQPSSSDSSCGSCSSKNCAQCG